MLCYTTKSTPINHHGDALGLYFVQDRDVQTFFVPSILYTLVFHSSMFCDTTYNHQMPYILSRIEMGRAGTAQIGTAERQKEEAELNRTQDITTIIILVC